MKYNRGMVLHLLSKAAYASKKKDQYRVDETANFYKKEFSRTKQEFNSNMLRIMQKRHVENLNVIKKQSLEMVKFWTPETVRINSDQRSGI